jgi:hypothetical protein
MNVISKVCSSLMMASLPLTAGCTQLGVRNEGQVRQVGDLPCFSVDDSEEAREGRPELAVLAVYQYGGEGRESEPVWVRGFVAADPPVRLSPDDCIVYGDNSRGDKEGAMDAVPLRSGVAYTYIFNSDIPYASAKGVGWKNRRYRGYFCLTQDAGGKVTVHEVRWSRKEERRLWDVCKLTDGAERSTF